MNQLYFVLFHPGHYTGDLRPEDLDIHCIAYSHRFALEQPIQYVSPKFVFFLYTEAEEQKVFARTSRNYISGLLTFHQFFG